jgi:hypothetical protein
MYKKILLSILLSFVIAQQGHSHSHSTYDEYVRCAADELEQELQLLNPEFIIERDNQILKAQKLLSNNPQWRKGSEFQETIYIPVIFHVLYANAGDNISAVQIGANFDQINLDFQNLNPDGDEIPSSPNPSNAPYDPGIDYSHQSVRGTHDIVFVGAAGETSGNLLIEGTTILRYPISTSSVSGVSNASDLASSIEPDQSTWPANTNGLSGGYRDGYMNIYIAPLTGGLLGQAYLGFPESVVLDESVGSVEIPGTAGGYNRGRTLTHELGHNFTYNHVFNASSCGQTIWSDVPDQYINNRGANIYEWPAGSGNFYGRSAENSCISSTGKGDQFMNYMDYVYDDQMRMFSEEQALEGYAWAASRNWAQVVNGVTTQISSDVSNSTSNPIFTIDVTFEEEVTGFTQEDIVLNNGTIFSFNGGDGTTYSFDVEAVQDGEVKVKIAANSCTGVSSGESNLPSNEYTVIVDTTPPNTGNVSIGNIQDSQYIIPDLPTTTGGDVCSTGLNCLRMLLSDFTDETSGVQAYYVSVGLSPTGEEILPLTAKTTEYFELDNLVLNNYQQYFVNVYAQDLVGLNSSTVSASFYYFGSIIGDFDGDWDIDFQDYAYFIANYPGVDVDIAPVTGSPPYLFPNFDNELNEKDINLFKSLWNWSLERENGDREEPVYTNIGSGSFKTGLINDELKVQFDIDASSGQFYMEYNPDDYIIDFIPNNLNNDIVLDGSTIIQNNSNNKGIIQLEIADYSMSRSTPIELKFSFVNRTGTYESLRYSFSSYNKSNQIVKEGFDYLQTAPNKYRLAQSYPNPFTSGGTTIEFDLPKPDTVSMYILDIRGRKIRTLIDKENLFSFQSVVWDAKNDDGENVSSGVYFYQIKSRNFNEVGKLVFVK